MLYGSRDYRQSSHKSRIDLQMHIMCFLVTLPELACHLTSSFNNFVIECSILAILHTSYNRGSKGMGGAFDLPMRVTISLNNDGLH